ncbi:MAG TPA: hypothetical protein VGM41_03640 [Chitinophagaceae bacterium]|jgi:hypothetical protein
MSCVRNSKEKDSICCIRAVLLFVLFPVVLRAQEVHEYTDSLVVSNGQATVVVNTVTGKLDYRFAGGIRLSNTVAYVADIHLGYIATAGFGQHPCSVDRVQEGGEKAVRINIKHIDDRPFFLLQRVTVYENHPYLLLELQVVSTDEKTLLETRCISPLAVLPAQNAHLLVTGNEPRILDMPFDNDDWVHVLERKWDEGKNKTTTGIGYNCASVYDNTTMAGMVAGSVTHDFWKTGIAYGAGAVKGVVDSFNVFGGAAVPDDPSLPADYGGRDGTHDLVPHGTMLGISVRSPVVYLGGGPDVRKVFVDYGKVNAKINGSLSWKGYAPFYWNSFGVEGVLGYSGVMMPAGVTKISDFIHSLDQFNRYAKPVMSIDSYDQSIYSTELLTSLGKYAAKKNQQLGFYFSPFATWTWKNSLEQTKLPGTDYPLRDAVLRDKDNQPIAYKSGDWAAFAMDPTSPATRYYIIGQLQKAKTINAKFIKIDFLTAGSLESTTRYDRTVRSGLQAYNYGMKMLKHLIDSIMGPDIFITQAISPMFPSQYAHTRFVSTDVYSHLRDDEPGFPSWGSTESSLATGSHVWWVQGTLWPYTNLDVSIMKNFQKNPDLSEQEIKVRLYAMMAMGSILGDGSDFRNAIAAERAKKYLNNANICAFFSNPKAFTPLKFADGESFDQQVSFYLPGDTVLVAMFNFSRQQEFKDSYSRAALGLKNGRYSVRDFMTGEQLGVMEKNEDVFSLTVPRQDARLVKLVPY